MTTPKDVILHQLGSGQSILDRLISDLSDAEYFRPPIPGANHTGWIIGHIACSEDSLVNGATGAAKRIPEATHALFEGGSPCVADASKYPSRKHIDELLRTTRAHTTEALKAFDAAKWDKPSPEGWSKDMFPTLGAIWSLIGTHPFWHIGQITVCRCAMSKKRLLV